MVDGGGEPRVPRPVHYQIITSDGTTEGAEGANIGAPGLTSAKAPASTQGTGAAQSGQTALRLAVGAGFESGHAVDLLIAYGADVDATDADGGSALGITANAGDLESVESLLRAGAEVNAKTEDGWTPLMNAAFDGRVRTAELLLDHGADVDATDVPPCCKRSQRVGSI